MTTITKTSKELTKKEVYQMTMSPKIQKISDNKGVVIDVAAYCYHSDVKKDGEEVDILSVMDNEGAVFATNSPTFMDDFGKICDIMDGEDFSIEVISGTSNAGREFVTCALV
jgi:hypothetical protein